MVDIYQPQLLFMPDLFLVAIKVVATVAVHKVNGCLTWWTNVTTASSLAIQPSQPLVETSNRWLYIYVEP